MSRNPFSLGFASPPRAPPSFQLERQRHQRHLRVAVVDPTEGPSDSRGGDEDDENLEPPVQAIDKSREATSNHGRRCCSCSQDLKKKLWIISSRLLVIGVLLIILYAIYAAGMTNNYHHLYEMGLTSEDYFPDYWNTMYSLFQMMVDSGMWAGVLREVMEVYPKAWVPFMSFFVLVSFISVPLTIVLADDALRNLFPPNQPKTDTEAWLEARMDELKNALEGKPKTPPPSNHDNSDKGKQTSNASAPQEGTVDRSTTTTYWNLQLRKLVVILARLVLIGVVFLIITLIYALLLTNWFGHTYELGYTRDTDYFGRLDYTLLTLFTMMVDGGTWAEVQSLIMAHYTWAWAPLLSFFVLSTFISIPLTVVVIDDAVKNLFPPVHPPTEIELLLEAKMDKLTAAVQEKLLESHQNNQPPNHGLPHQLLTTKDDDADRLDTTTTTEDQLPCCSLSDSMSRNNQETTCGSNSTITTMAKGAVCVTDATNEEEDALLPVSTHDGAKLEFVINQLEGEEEKDGWVDDNATTTSV